MARQARLGMTYCGQFGHERGRKVFDNVPNLVHIIIMRASEPLSVFFFKTDSGSEPVRNWLREDLTSAQRTIIGKDLKMVQFMWPIGMPLVRPLGDGLWELRSVLDDGIARVLFTFYQNHILLLHGFIKKSAKTPKSDLVLARKRKAAFKKG